MTATVPAGRQDGSAPAPGNHDSAPERITASPPAPMRRVADWLGDSHRLVTIGLIGAVLLLIGSLGAGAMPGYDPLADTPVLSWFRSGWLGLRIAMAITYIGLAMIVGVWLLLGRALYSPEQRQVAEHEQISVALLRRAALLWSVPLVFSAPLFSRDLYAYAAQAQLMHAGLDPYVNTPADMPGQFLDEVAWRWVDSPAPYGPLWLALGRGVAAVSGSDVMRTVIGVRLLAVLGLALVLWLLPRLAVRVGGDPRTAIWLGALNPLVLLHFVAGGHNDALMVGLGIAGLAVAATASGKRLGGLRGDAARLGGAGALLALAIAVKSPAVVMLAFAVPVWAAVRGQIRQRSAWVHGTVIALGSSVATFAVVTAATGLGMGWVRQVNTSIPVVNWLSLPTSLAMLARWVNGSGMDRAADGTVEAFRTGGTILTAIVLICCWGAARRWRPMELCAISLAVIVLLGPSAQPWYYAWALTVAAASWSATQLRVAWWLAFGSVALMLATLPEGNSIVGKPLPWALTLVASAVAVRATFMPLIRLR